MAKFAFSKTYVSGEMISWGDYVFSFLIFGFWRQIYNFPWGGSKLRKKRVFGKKRHFAGISFSYSFSKLFLAAQWWNVMNSMCYKKYVMYGAAVRDWGVAHGPGQMMEAKQVAWFKSSTRPDTWHKVLQNTSIREVVTNRPTDWPTDWPTNQQMDRASYRGAS